MSDHEQDVATVRGWLTGRLPQEWTTAGTPTVEVDREEVTVVLAVEALATPGEAGEAERAQVAQGRIAAFREDTRERRMAIAREAEHRFGRKVAWGVACGDERELFTHLAVPVMTRLRQPERKVLDTLVASGVARSRAHALAWCVRLVGQHSGDWLAELRTAMEQVEQVRDRGPAQ
jgi:hypothetical protein